MKLENIMFFDKSQQWVKIIDLDFIKDIQSSFSEEKRSIIGTLLIFYKKKNIITSVKKLL